MNEKFAICTKPRHIRVGKTAPIDFSVRATRKGFSLALIGDRVDVPTELELWESISRLVGSSAWVSMEQYSVIQAGMSHRGQLMLMGGQLLLDEKLAELKTEMCAIYQCFMDSHGLRVVSKGITINQPSYSRPLAMWLVRAKVVLPYTEGKSEVVMHMVPDPLDANGWHITVKMPEGGEDSYQRNREFVRTGLNAVTMHLGITLVDINQGANFYW